ELKDAAGEPTEERVRRWLGAASEEKTSPASSVDPVRGRLAFGDFVTPAVGGETITRVKVDAARDAVDEGALQVIEAPFAPGEAVPFTGQISYFAADEDEHREISKWVVQGLRWVTNLGALENVNFGRLVKVESDRGEIFDISSPPTGARAKGCDYLDVVVRPLGPFCIAKRRAVKNLFESEKV